MQNDQKYLEDFIVNSIIGEGSEFIGEFKVDGLIRIDGKFKGLISTNGKVLIGKTGTVDTDIRAKIVVSGGTITGNIYASERVILLATSKIYGDIVTPNLVLEDGALFSRKVYGDTRMKIFGTNDSVKNTNEKKSKTLRSESTSSVSPKDSSFLEILEQIVPSNREETREINELWQRLPDAEKHFLQEPNRKNLESYKELVKEITNAILKSNTTLVQARQRGRMDKKVLMTVKVIDENIQLLAMTMLNPANSAFGLLKQIEKIRGLLLDLSK